MNHKINFLACILAVLLLSSCYTSKVAKKQVIKAQTNHPAIVASACALYYPPKDSQVINTQYIQGATDTFLQYVEIECPATNDTTPGAVQKIKVPCPPSTHRVDTFFDHQYHYQENTAEVESLRSRILDYEAGTASLETKLSTKEKTIRYLGGFLAAFALSWVVYFFMRRTVLK